MNDNAAFIPFVKTIFGKMEDKNFSFGKIQQKLVNDLILSKNLAENDQNISIIDKNYPLKLAALANTHIEG